MSYGFGRLNDLADDCWQIAEDHGFHDADINNVRTQLSWMALIHTEVSEASECIRKPELREHLGEELADVIIRTIETARQLSINIEQEVVNKIEKNRVRPYKHGGKLA